MGAGARAARAICSVFGPAVLLSGRQPSLGDYSLDCPQMELK